MWWIVAGSLACISFWRPFALVMAAIALICACIEGVVDVYGLMALGVIAVLCRSASYLQQRPRAGAIGVEVLLVAAALALFLHWVPGFHNPQIVDAVKAGPHSAPFSMNFNFDKALLPFILLAVLPTLMFKPSPYHPRIWQWLLLAASVPVLLWVAVLLGGLRLEPHFPDWLVSFMLANLFFVSLAEEALFRGYLQQRLAGWLGHLPALLIVAVVFGLAHIAGGMLLVVFATLAGIIYGLAWMWSGRVWVSTLFHFGLNMCHLLLFTYPMYQH